MSGTVNFGYNIPLILWGKLTEASGDDYQTTEDYILDLMEACVHNGYGLSPKSFADYLLGLANTFEKYPEDETFKQVEAIRAFGTWLRNQTL